MSERKISKLEHDALIVAGASSAKIIQRTDTQEVEQSRDKLIEEMAVELEKASVGGKVYEGLQYGAYILRNLKGENNP